MLGEQPFCSSDHTNYVPYGFPDNNDSECEIPPRRSTYNLQARNRLVSASGIAPLWPRRPPTIHGLAVPRYNLVLNQYNVYGEE